MPYNLTELTNSENILDIVLFANSTSDSVLLSFFVVAIFFIMVMALKRYDFDKALLSSSFTCFVISAAGTYAKLINVMFPLAFLTAAAFTALYMWMSKR